MKPRKTSLTLIGLIALGALLVASNVLVSTLAPDYRLDLTQDRTYTLSSGTKQVLASLDEPIRLRLFLSERLSREAPGYAPFAQRVRDLLAEYQTLAKGKLTVETYNPEPFTDLEDRAESYGLQGVPVNQEGDQVYFGLVGTNTTDDTETIAFFQTERERFLEYDLTRMVNKLAHPKQKVVGVISSLPIFGDPMAAMEGGAPQPWLVVNQLRQFFDVRPLPAELETVPADIDVLMLVHPAAMNEQTRYAVDQYVLGGGKAMVFVDPYSETAAAGAMQAMRRGMPGAATSSDLPKLLEAWGVKMEPKLVVGDRRNARRVNAGTANRPRAADYLPWIGVPAETMNQSDPITAQLELVNVASAGSLVPVDGATTRLEPLLSSSEQAETIPVEQVMGNPPDIQALLRNFKAGGRILTMAARITGPAKTAFPDGLPKKKPDDAKPAETKEAAPAAPQIMASRGPIDVVVVADTDLLEDRMWAQSENFFGERVTREAANNASFVVNALDNLAGSSGLIALRSRGLGDRPFTLIKDLQADADSQFAEQEQALNDKIKATRAKLAELKHGDAGSDQAVSPDQQKTIDSFRADLARTRTALRDVQHSLRAGIERLENAIKIIDIAAVPALVAGFAIVLAALRARRRRRAHKAHAG
jgi:ABC-type uncharacterized transport system involved in gliding motility auxiliary subunit